MKTSIPVQLSLLFLACLLTGACQPQAPAETAQAGTVASQEAGIEQEASVEQEAGVEQEADVEARLREMGITLPEQPAPVANYVQAVRTGNLVFLAGHGPLKEEGGYVTGKVGEALTLEEGYDAARKTAIALLASLKQEIGDLNRVRRIVRVFGMVNAGPDFTQHPQVINGCSDFLVELFGEERGRHARAAVGMVSLPIGISVEIEMVVEVE
jgi:enamine deaminase RidA (YjgF/YER057c/UK114 family)